MDNTFEKEHTYVSTVKTAATCTEKGLMEYKCACGDSYTEEIPALGHDYKVTVIAPTETADGYTIHFCKRCTYSYVDSKVPKLPKKELNIGSCTVKLSTAKCIYKGKGVAPRVTVKDDGKKLTKGTDYKLSYQNYIKPGKASITVTGIGNYSGKQTVYYNIAPGQAEIVSVTSSAKGRITTKWKKDTLADGYRIQFASDSAFKKIVKNAYAKKNTIISGTVTKGLTSGKTYYVRVISYKTIDGKRSYGPASEIRSVKVR